MGHKFQKRNVNYSPSCLKAVSRKNSWLHSGDIWDAYSLCFFISHVYHLESSNLTYFNNLTSDELKIEPYFMLICLLIWAFILPNLLGVRRIATFLLQCSLIVHWGLAIWPVRKSCWSWLRPAWGWGHRKCSIWTSPEIEKNM